MLHYAVHGQQEIDLQGSVKAHGRLSASLSPPVGCSLNCTKKLLFQNRGQDLCCCYRFTREFLRRNHDLAQCQRLVAIERPNRLDSLWRGGETKRTVGLPLNDSLPDQRRNP